MWTSAEVTDLIAGVEIMRITREIVRLHICHLHGHLSSLVWCLSWFHLTVDLKIALLTFLQDVVCLLPDATSGQALTVDLSKYVIDVYSRCGPSLAARDTVEPVLTFLPDVVRLLPHATQWRLPLKS